MNCNHCGIPTAEKFCDADCETRWNENQAIRLRLAKEAEATALQISSDRASLRNRLNSAKSCLLKEYKLALRNAKFDFKNKRLRSKCGRYELQWQLRLYPYLPESYENQQTTQGCVVLNQITQAIWTPSLN